MKDTIRHQAEELFQRVADLPPAQREQYLREHCPNDPSVLAEVRSLLAYLGAETIASLRIEDSTDRDFQLAGQRIGPYRLLELIGEGGFGSVYVAEQEQPFLRRVALKIIKLGMDTKQVIARFEAERQALAMMDHPNIARVFDAGATTTGRPYFVMELVRGIPITEYCDRNNLPTEDRLKLFMQVCHAVQHAHQKGIIHRDIKPSNVMVTLHDVRPVPKIIDFGIAKATSRRLTEKTLYTEFRQFVGTPEYTSPEQAEMSGLDVDTRSDIYSLGVLLYELLTGTTPFDPDSLRRAGYGEIQRIIREEEPPTPSSRLSTLGRELAEIAHSRQAEPRALSRLIRGDLDWIVMKALEKDRTRRYETAEAMAADIQRHLDNQPVHAGPPSAANKLRKFVRRNRVSVVSGSFVAAALLIGLAIATAGFLQARADRDEARLARAKAEREAAGARAASDYLRNMLASADPMQLREHAAFASDVTSAVTTATGFARDVSVAEMVRLAAGRIDEVFDGKPALEADARETVGMTMWGLGLYFDAEPQLTAALDLRRRTLGADDPDTMCTAAALGHLLLDMGRGEEAEPIVREALDGMREIYGEEHPRTLGCASILASVISSQRRYGESNSLFQQTLEAQRRILGDEHRDTLLTMWQFSTSYYWQWRFDEGDALARELYEVSRRTLPPNDILNIVSGPLMASWLIDQYRYEEAQRLLRPGLEQCRQILGKEHPFTYMTTYLLASSLRGRDHLQEKERLSSEAVEGLRATQGAAHWYTTFAASNLAVWIEERGRIEEAEQMLRRQLSDCRRFPGEENIHTLCAMARLANVLERTGRMDEAIAVRRNRISVAQRAFGRPHPRCYEALSDLTEALVRSGRITEARAVTAEHIAARRSVAESPDAELTTLNRFAWLLLTCQPPDMRDPALALEMAQRAVEFSPAPDAACLDTLALALHRVGRSEEAARAARRAIDLLPVNSLFRPGFAAAMICYLRDAGETKQAEQVIRETVTTFAASLDERTPDAFALLRDIRGQTTGAGDDLLARLLLEELARHGRSRTGDGREQVEAALRALAELHYDRGRYGPAADALREAIELRRSLIGDDDLVTIDALHRLGLALQGSGDADASVRVLREALEAFRSLDLAQMPAAVAIKRDLADALIAMRRLEEAEPLAREALPASRDF
ncbi:MAG: tetratricopeptide repeat protein [Phycisphaerales bacterium]|nr:MAG: tetratricopeptide repeat protein [Phycisphaerales bacterium]